MRIDFAIVFASQRARMTTDDFRNLALSLPETSERAHVGHPDFRVGGKIFATLWPGDEWGMVKLTPEQQGEFMVAEPDGVQDPLCS